MNETAVKTYADYVLPPSVVTRPDLSRLVTDLERVDNELTAAIIRAKTPGTPQQTAPTLSQQLTEFATLNKISLADSQDRTNLIKQMRTLKDNAPVIHMTFAVEADRESLMKLAQWLRTSVHRQALISVGLQPSLVAGVYLRTPNKVHDLSLRSKLEAGRDVLIKELGALRG